MTDDHAFQAVTTSSTAHRFLIVRLGALGDVVHGIPVVAALRERFPSARIDWMVDPRYVPLLGQVQGLSVAIPVEPRRVRESWSTVRSLRALDYSAVIDLQGLVKSAVLARAVGAWRTIGFPRAHLREPLARAFYSDTPDPGERQHVIEKNLALLAPLGVRAAVPAFPIAVPQSDVADAVAAQCPAGYVAINPGAAWPNKRWPAERFGAVAARTREALGLPTVIVWGPGEEGLAGAVMEASGGASVLAPPTTVLDLLALFRGARLMLSGDTGPLHLAAAVGTPVVALFGPTTAARNGPWSTADITLSRTATCVCLYRRRCRRPAPCIDDIAANEVMDAVFQRLDE